MQGVLLYELREVHLLQVDDKYFVTIDGAPEDGGEFSNPLEAWTRFIELIDMRVRRRIGDLLEKQGFNRYTGLGKIKETTAAGIGGLTE